MRGTVFASAGDEPLHVIDMGDGYGVLSQLNERGEVESIGTDAQRLRDIADYLEGRQEMKLAA